MTGLTRRDALRGATAAAIVTGVTVAPLAAKEALGSDLVLPAYEAFEAARLNTSRRPTTFTRFARRLKLKCRPSRHGNGRRMAAVDALAGVGVRG
jgi:hypothetical protein